MRPDIDGRLAQRLRELPDVMDKLKQDEFRRICEIAADLLEEYIMAARPSA